MGGVMAAYLLSLGVITVRWVKGPKQPPPPMAFLGASLIFGVSGLLAQYDKKLGTTVAWAFLAGAIFGPKLPQIKPIQMMFGDTGIPLEDYPQGTYPDGTVGPTNAGPDLPFGILVGPNGQKPVPPNPPGVMR